jgi:hypothetical protein
MYCLLYPFAFILFTLFMGFTHKGYAQATYPSQKYVCYKSPNRLKIDGKLNENAWERAEWTSEFVDIEGDKQPKPLYSTRVKMLWDDDFFYIAAELIEPNLWATYTERESVIYHENDFEVFIDPDGDTHHYYEYEINALGTDWDLMLTKPYRDQGMAVNGWNINQLQKGIQLVGTLNKPKDTDTKWVIELAFPWKILKECAPNGSKPTDLDQWRINFSRVEWRLTTQNGKYIKEINPQTQQSFPEYNWVWSPQGVIAMHQPESWGFVQFSAQTVGSTKVNFIENPDEIIKWQLRQLYYLEHSYFAKNQQFTDNIDTLLKSNQAISISNLTDLQIQTTQSRFEITSQGTNPQEVWHIQDDGRVWKSEKK